MHDNARPERRRVFGFPDFIPTVEAEYPRFFEVGPGVLTYRKNKIVCLE